MSKPVIFPYGITLKDGGNLDTFPAVEASFKITTNEWITLFLLLDSGAALSALPRSDAAFLGIDVERGFPMHISGISGEPIQGWRHNLTVQLVGEKVVIPVVFLDDVNAPRVLGRADVFGKFTIIFEECRNRSIFLRTGSKEAHTLRDILETL